MIILWMPSSGGGGAGDGMTRRVRRVFDVLSEATFGWRGPPPDLADTLEASGLLKSGCRAEIQRCVDEEHELSQRLGFTFNDRSLAEALDKAGLIKRWWNW